MEKSKQPKREDGDGMVDFISNMPDEILVLIISRLGLTQEEIRTSILSRRWRYLWNSTPSISISTSSFHNSWERKKVEEYVYGLLVNRSVDLDRFRLSCHYGFSMSTVGKWIDAAVTRNVKELDLTLRDAIELPHCLVACGSLEELSLNMEVRGLRLRNVKAGFKALRVLCLRSAVLYDDDDVVNAFFQNCPLLEELSLFDCTIRKFSHLCISCPKLKELIIMNDEDDERDKCHSINISCPNLVFLALIGHVAYNIFFEYCLDSLKEAEIDPKLIENTTSVFPAISHVESLTIDLYFFSQCINDVRAPALPNLRNLVLTTTIITFTMTEFNRILKYCSKLEFLELIVIKDYAVAGEWDLHDGDARRIMTSDLKRMEFFELNGEKPKVYIDWRATWDELEMVFSWGN